MGIQHKQASDWSRENIQDFWDWQSKSGSALYNYFTAVNAKAIIRLLKYHKVLNGDVLDFGCGSGLLLNELSGHKDLRLTGIDSSSASVESARTLLSGKADIIWLQGFPVSFSDNQFDTITFIETIEHLPEDSLHGTLAELYRILKPGGSIFLTTPFNEDIQKHMIFCPFCRSEFHHMQHMRSFNVDSLSGLIASHGFTVKYCNNIDMERWRLGTFKYYLKKLFKQLAEGTGLKDKGIEYPNLVAIISK